MLAEAAVIMAGVARMPFGRFMVWTGLANLGISVIYAATGALAMSWNSFLLALAAAILLPLVALLATRRGREMSFPGRAPRTAPVDLRSDTDASRSS